MGKKIDPRNGAPKLVTNVAAHPGMSFIESVDGVGLVRFTGVSRTQVGHATQSGGIPINQSTAEKSIYRQGQAPTHPSQTMRGECRAKPGDACAVLNDAVMRVPRSK